MIKNVLDVAYALMTIALFILCVDFVFFTLWLFSGQTPVDNFYFGTITAHALQWLISLVS